jgi:hypothetical protein
MVGSYIVNEPSKDKIIRRVGKGLNVDRGISPDFYQERVNRAKINVLVFPINQEKKGKLLCSFCQQRLEIMSKKQIIDSYSSIGTLDTHAAEKAKQRINEELGDNEEAAYCTHCGKLHSVPEVHIVPKNIKASYVCPKCIDETLGLTRTLKPEKLNVIRSDPNSPKLWYWSCSLCSHKYPMENSNLKMEILGEQKSFVKSIETIKKKPSNIPQEDRDALSQFGTITSLVDQRDITSKGY